MFSNAKNCSIKIEDTEMDYITFGRGKKNLIMIPGLGDAIKTVKGLATSFAIEYRKYAKDYMVYVFSRKNQMENGYSTRKMAKDLAETLKRLGISKAIFMGVSQGGMIAQYVAIDYPELVEKLVLAVTVSRPNETLKSVIGDWITMAKLNDYKGIIISTAEKSYSDNRIKKVRLLYPILSRVGKPRDFSRFIVQATACIYHNSYNELEKIKCPTLVIGGDSDKVVGKDSSQEIAEIIENSKCLIYPGLGHATCEEARDFNSHVLNFLRSEI